MHPRDIEEVKAGRMGNVATGTVLTMAVQGGRKEERDWSGIGSLENVLIVRNRELFVAVSVRKRRTRRESGRVFVTGCGSGVVEWSAARRLR
jgi:hypothetical protein